MYACVRACVCVCVCVCGGGGGGGGGEAGGGGVFSSYGNNLQKIPKLFSEANQKMSIADFCFPAC